MTGQTFCATGLYFFFDETKTGLVESIDVGKGIKEVCIGLAFEVDKYIAY